MKDSIFKTYGVFIITFVLMFYTLGAGLIDNYVIYPTFATVGENEFVAFRAVFSPRIVALLVVPLILASFQSSFSFKFLSTALTGLPVLTFGISLHFLSNLVVFVIRQIANDQKHHPNHNRDTDNVH